MFCWFWQWNKFENRSIFDEIKACKQRVSVFWPPCIEPTWHCRAYCRHTGLMVGKDDWLDAVFALKTPFRFRCCNPEFLKTCIDLDQWRVGRLLWQTRRVRRCYSPRMRHVISHASRACHQVTLARGGSTGGGALARAPNPKLLSSLSLIEYKHVYY